MVKKKTLNLSHFISFPTAKIVKIENLLLKLASLIHAKGRILQ